MIKERCSRCGDRKFYQICRKRRRCSRCYYETRIIKRIGGLKLTKKKWKDLIFWFVLEQPIRGIEKYTGLSHYLAEKAVKILRTVMIYDIPGIFSGTIEVDETYLGGQKKNSCSSTRPLVM